MAVPTIVNYARVSSTKQLQGVGLETQLQREVLEDLSLEHGLPIYTEAFVDRGLSAFHGDHKEAELGRVLGLINNGQIASGSILVVFSLDRLSRESTNLAMLQLLQILNSGVRVYTHSDQKLYDSGGDTLSADLIMSLLIMERANEESRVKSQRIKGAMQVALKQWYETGKPQSTLGRVPLWIDQPTNEFNDNAQGIRKAVDLLLEGKTPYGVKKYLDKHFPFKVVKKRKFENDKMWSIDTITALHTRVSLIGTKVVRVDEVSHELEGYYPPLIDQKSFFRLKQIRAKTSGRATKNDKIHVLKGLATCHHCGSKMVFVDKGRPEPTYICSNASKGNHPREAFNVRVLEYLSLEISKDIYLSEKASLDLIDDSEVRVKEELEAAHERLKDLTKLYREKKSLTIAELIVEAEEQIELLTSNKKDLKDEQFRVTSNYLKDDLYTDAVRKDFTEQSRAKHSEGLRNVLDRVILSRVEQVSQFTKTGSVSCIKICWLFKNGQKRELTLNPFEYVNDDESKEIYIPYRYKYDVPIDEFTRSATLIHNCLKRLHEWNLLEKLYPSKGRYQWKERKLNLGQVSSAMTNMIPKGVDLGNCESIRRAFSVSGIQHTQIESNFRY
ncbi:recombinase family protein [Vibrio splendidus]|uniref:recombinase family protein n=1 Tax=Vibrio splendidus TaxID=29497 RepID=UPI001197B69E|nr:recombinase family protein [Vibrio splendidus]NOI91279.1 recombinase family protein [Vibrio splendidus]TVU61132.1 recombinase family protein [Vibrio atlanticus]